MGDYVMAQAFKFIARQPLALRENPLFTLNISQVQLNDTEFSARALDMMQKNNLSPRNFILKLRISSIRRKNLSAKISTG